MLENSEPPFQHTSGPKGEEGYWLKHVAVGEFEMEDMQFKPGTVLDMPKPLAPKCK